jgi:hypothetical protein
VKEVIRMRKLTPLIFSIVLLNLTALAFTGQVENDLRNKGLHVAVLSDEDKINLQVNRLEQAISQQRAAEIGQMLWPDYEETQSSIRKATITEELQIVFSKLNSARQLAIQTNTETGWRVTSSHDFYIRNLGTQIEADKATVQCELGLSFGAQEFKGLTDTLRFVLENGKWFLCQSTNLFGWLKNASDASTQDIETFQFAGGALQQTKDDFVSSHLLVPVTFYNHGKTAIPRFNKTESQNWFGVNCMNSPCGIVADIEICAGGLDFNHDYLFVSDVTSNKIIGSNQDNWVGEFGSQGSGEGQFWGPKGICTVRGYYYFAADMFNNRVTCYEYHNQVDEPIFRGEFDLEGDVFNHPRDVEAKDRNPYDEQDKTYIAVADKGNHRIVLFHWDPWTLGWDRNYGEYGSGQGQFMWPTSVCFGRDPALGYQTNDVFVTDYGNRRLVRFYIEPEGGIIWRGSYEFPVGTELTSVEVDNKGLVYVVDRHHGKVYKFAPSESYPYYFALLGIWGETGIEDGQLYHPNMLQVAHGRYVPYPDTRWIPLNYLGDVFVSESWGDQTGVRRFVIAADVLNLTADWVPYNEDTGEGNFIWWEYSLTDFATVTEEVLLGAQVCTTYNEGSLNWGGQAGAWPVDGHPHGTYYTVKVTASSNYEPTIVVEKSLDVYVDTISTHNPIITEGIRCHWINEQGAMCDGCWQCIKEWQGYTIDVQAYDPDGDPLTYEWHCGRGYFWIDDKTFCNPCFT